MTINSASPSSLIEAWQTFLYAQSFTAVGKPDGIWGANTEAASKEFQKAHGLTADGIVGAGTIAVAEQKGFVVPAAKEFEPAGTVNAVFDISHLNDTPDFAKAKAAGMQAVFHKATQSISPTAFVDHAYADRRKAARAEGLLWGAYHFGSGGDGSAQADFFLEHAAPDGNTLLVLDFERNPTESESTMTLAEAKAFISSIHDKTGKYPGLYGGAKLKEMVRSHADPVLSKCWLWIAQYGDQPVLPNGWSQCAFWQFTDGIHGPGALPIDGVGRCDRDLFYGATDRLSAFWKKYGV